MLVLSFLISLQVHADMAKINKIEFENKDNIGRVKVYFEGVLKNRPKLVIRDKIIQVSLSDAIIWPQVKRNISLTDNDDAVLMGYQFDKETVRVRTILPFELKRKKDIKVVLNTGFFEIHFPHKSYFSDIDNHSNKKIVKENRGRIKKEYDETYLNYLLEQDNKNSKSVFKNLDKTYLHNNQDTGEALEDTVQITQSALEKSKDETIEKKSFDVMAYIGRYIAFLGLILLFIYGLFFIFRKNFLRRGKLGILGNTELVSVLSTTHIGPKRSLLLVKVHNKVVLIGNSESGINYLSELDEISKLLKEGEEEITGSNFDTTIDNVNENKIEERVKLKENPLEESRNGNKSSRLSEQIKKRVKELRPLQ